MPTKKKPSMLPLNRTRLMLLGAGLLLSILCVRIGWQAYLANQDVQTRKSAAVVGDALDRYISKYNAVPYKLSDADVSKTAKNIYYKYVDGEHFRLCAVFKRANNPSANKLKQFGRLIYTSKQPMLTDELSNSAAYHGVPSFDDFHLAGPDCNNVYYYTFWSKK